MKSLIFTLILAVCGAAMANEVLALRFAYFFQQPNTQPYLLDGQTWYVHQTKGISLTDFAQIKLLETNDAYQPIKLEITLKPRSHQRFRQDMIDAGTVPGVMVLSNNQAVGTLPVMQGGLPQSFILPIRDPATNRSIYEALKDQM